MRTCPPITLALLTTALASQSYVTSPPGMSTTEGDLSAQLFGNQAHWRHQILDGELRGTRRTLKSIAFRPDYRHHPTTFSINSARSWQIVTIDLCDTDAGRPAAAFRNNILATPTRVFQSAVRWPALSGLPSTKPAPWSLRLPFRQGYVYSGTRDLCIDYRFLGGTTHWQNKTYPLGGATYLLDAHQETGGNYRVRTISGPKRCKDSGQSRPASLLARAVTHRDNRSTLLTVLSVAQHTGGKPVAHAVSLTHNAAGLPYPGVTCQSLFLTGPILTGIPATRSPSAHVFATIPYSPRYLGVKLYFQAGFNDSRFGLVPLLTPAVESTVMPPPRGPFRRVSVDGFLLNNNGRVARDTMWIPVHRFSH